jgi:hypothetical protein
LVNLSTAASDSDSLFKVLINPSNSGRVRWKFE